MPAAPQPEKKVCERIDDFELSDEEEKKAIEPPIAKPVPLPEVGATQEEIDQLRNDLNGITNAFTLFQKSAKEEHANF